jgi:hypothetical protein
MANAIVDTATYGTVKCPICELAHDLRKTKNKGAPFFVCDTCGSGTVVFIRSAWAKERLRQWTAHATHVSLRNEAAEDRTSVPSKEAKTPEEYPADEAEDHVERLIREWSVKPVRRRVSRH